VAEVASMVVVVANSRDRAKATTTTIILSIAMLCRMGVSTEISVTVKVR